MGDKEKIRGLCVLPDFFYEEKERKSMFELRSYWYAWRGSNPQHRCRRSEFFPVRLQAHLCKMMTLFKKHKKIILRRLLGLKVCCIQQKQRR